MYKLKTVEEPDEGNLGTLMFHHWLCGAKKCREERYTVEVECPVKLGIRAFEHYAGTGEKRK
jgi:hypothetical protein